jgi:AcrR family transcriptional regulator
MGRTKAQAGRQAEKSAATRQAAIDGAVTCFLELGYARSSTIEIAKVAGVSRGAMIYHFPTKRRLLEAVVEYIISERIRRFTREIRRMASAEDREAQRGIDIYWRHLHSHLFTAFHELTVASRTDRELARVMRSANARFEREWLDAIREVFPEWADKGPLFDLAMDLTQFLLEGMALNKLSHDARRRRQRIVEYLKSRLIEIFKAASEPNRDLAVRRFLDSAPVREHTSKAA